MTGLIKNKMWSEIFFLNLKDFSKHLTNTLSHIEIEHAMLEVLREDSNTRKWFLEHKLAFPEAVIQDCAVFWKESVMTKNRSVEYLKEPN
jgi:hypothetical protein